MSKIAEVSLYFPEKVMNNEDFFKIFPEERKNNTWSKLGVDKRHIIGDEERSMDMGLKAAQNLLQTHPNLIEEIDYILFCSPERDYYNPATSGVLQAKLNLRTDIGCVDVLQGCSSYIYLLAVADGLITINAASKVLIVVISSLTKMIDKDDKSNRFIFGDGAAAYIIEKSDSEKIHSYRFGNDGDKKDKIITQDGFFRNPINENSFLPFINDFGEKQIPGKFYQQGAGVFRFVLDRIPKMITSILEENNWSKDDIDLYLFHQPNGFILKNLTKIAKLPAEKVVIDVADYGNTVGVTIPILINNLKKQNKIKPGMKILIAAFGTGLSWNGCIWET